MSNVATRWERLIKRPVTARVGDMLAVANVSFGAGALLMFAVMRLRGML